jgi:hypothetical protein
MKRLSVCLTRQYRCLVGNTARFGRIDQVTQFERTLAAGWPRQLSEIMEGLQYSLTTKGKAAVVYRGYRYRVKKTVDTTVYWQCLEPGCLGRLKTNALGVTPGGQHTHSPFHGKSMRPPCRPYGMRLGKHAQNNTRLSSKHSDGVPRIRDYRILGDYRLK